MAGLEDTRTMASAPVSDLAETTAPPPRPDPLATQTSGRAPWEGPALPDGEAGDPPKIGRFVVLREIGRGAMGVVYAGYDDELDRRVALKLVQATGHDDPSLGRNQLLREAQALARLGHPNVVAVHEAGVFEGSVFIAMEYVDGVDLQRWLTAAPRSWREIVGALRQAGEGLKAAHAVGLVHRDFKPSNVLVGVDGRVRVADFGLATRRGKPGRIGHVLPTSDPGLAATAAVATLAGSGALIGTPAYMAPEQLRRESATALSDQFAFCVALHEALYGRRPFVGDSLEQLTEQVLHAEPPPPPADAPVPAWLHAVVVRGLAKDPGKRYASIDELLTLLAHDPEAERERRRQRLGQLALAVAATVVLVLAGLWVYRALVRAAHERRAEARLEVLREQLAELTARKQQAEAARLFAAFADLPDNRGTAALVQAYREWGASQTDDAAAIDAHAGAYIAARTADDQLAALRDLAVRLARSGAVSEAAAALAALDARTTFAGRRALDTPELAAARVAAALDRRDLVAAQAALLHLGTSDPTRTYGQVLKHLSHGTTIAHADLGQRDDYVHAFNLGDLDGDGDPELITHADLRGSVLVMRSDPALTRIAEVRAPGLTFAPSPLPPALAGVPLVLYSVDNPGGNAANNYVHAAVRLDGTREFEWIDSPVSDAIVADVDGDGRGELFAGSLAYARKLSRIDRDRRGAWLRRSAHLSTDASTSDVTSLAAGDLDGDGRAELVVAVGAWSAYDLRVFRADDRGELRLLARRSLGFVEDLALVRSGDETLIAVAKRDSYENPGRFSAAAPFGEPAGLYLFALNLGEFEVRQFFPQPRPDDSESDFMSLRVGDLDGDGRDDLVAGSRNDTALLRRGDDGFLDPLWLRAVRPLALADFDDDPAAELLAHVGDPKHYMLLGVGYDPLAPRAAAVAAARTVADGDAADPAVLDAWRHAEELAAFGLQKRSAAELALLARLSEHAREDMLLRAAELDAAAGQHAAAAELFVAAADRPDLAHAALTGAIASRRALGEFAAAEALAATRAALPGLDPAVRAAAEAELAALRQAGAARPELPLGFGEPLVPRWQIFDPLAVARDPGRAGLSFQTSVDTLLAEYPLEWDGGTAGLTVDLSFGELDWGTELTIAVTPADSDQVWLGVRIEARGQTERPRYHASFVVDGRVLAGETTESGEMHRVRLAVHHYPTLDLAVGEHARSGESATRTPLPIGVVRTPPRGPLRLRLYNNPAYADTIAEVLVHRIDLAGLRPGPAIAGDDPQRELALLLAENDVEPALTRLAGAATGHAALWRADLLARAGRIDDAAAALHRLLLDLADDDPLRRRVRHRLLRDPDNLVLAARRALGPALWDMFVDLSRREFMWRPARVRFHLADLADLPLAPPPAKAGPDALRAHRNGLFLRALAWNRAGRADLVLRDLEAVLPELVGPENLDMRRYALRRLLEAAIRVRDPQRARKWIAAALEESASNELTLEIIRKRPGIESLLSPADWSRFEALVRH